MNSLLYAGYSAQNRTKASGYEHIVEFRDTNYHVDYLDAANLPFGFIQTGMRGKRINLYFLEIFSHLRAYNYNLIHNFYCDNQLLFSYPKNRKFGAIATTHLNYHDFSKKQLQVLRSYDKVIVLNSKEEEVLKSFGIDSVFIPHGFDRPKFHMNCDFKDRYKDYVNICFSGICYRDYKTLFFFLNEIKGKKNIVLHILGQKREIKERIRSMNYTNVIVYDFLPDDDYYSIMSMCDYSFLPLTFATANNTLLEAEFLGIRSIIPNIEGTIDYASMQYNLFYQSEEELHEIIIKLEKEEVCNKLIKYSDRFQWKNIFRSTKIIYDDVLSKY